jgi:hypothetical protein
MDYRPAGMSDAVGPRRMSSLGVDENGTMTMSGERWLDQVFRPAVAAVRQVRPREPLRALGSRLAAQLEALGDTGVLTDEQETTALDALAEAGIMPEVRSVSASSSSASSASVAAHHPTRLRGVVAGPRPLGQFDGRPVTLIAAELWSDRFLVDLYTDPGPEYRSTQARTTREHLEWIGRQRRGQAAERPAPVVSPLLDLTWQLHDEHGTEYRQTGGSAGTEHHLARQRTQWSPAPPPNCERVTLLATDTIGAVVLNVEIPVPTT